MTSSSSLSSLSSASFSGATSATAASQQSTRTIPLLTTKMQVAAMVALSIVTEAYKNLKVSLKDLILQKYAGKLVISLLQGSTEQCVLQMALETSPLTTLLFSNVISRFEPRERQGDFSAFRFILPSITTTQMTALNALCETAKSAISYAATVLQTNECIAKSSDSAQNEKFSKVARDLVHTLACDFIIDPAFSSSTRAAKQKKLIETLTNVKVIVTSDNQDSEEGARAKCIFEISKALLHYTNILCEKFKKCSDVVKSQEKLNPIDDALEVVFAFSKKAGFVLKY